jgi:hypothetical protein
MENHLPEEVEAYLAEIVDRLTDHLKDQLVGVYLFGSASYGAYEPGISDLDVQAVVKDRLTIVDKEAIVHRVHQETLPCPATKLEFVVYAQDSVMPAGRHPRFELNLNTGPQQQDHVSFDPVAEPSHWFLLDIATGRQLGRCFYGSAVSEVFDVIPRAWVLEAMAHSLDWHQANEASSANSVLNACRAWQFIATGEFSSKSAGVKWAMKQQNCPAVVETALEARKTGNELAAAEALALYDLVASANRDALRTHVPPAEGGVVATDSKSNC